MAIKRVTLVPSESRRKWNGYRAVKGGLALAKAIIKRPAGQAELVHDVEFVGKKLDLPLLIDIDAGRGAVEDGDAREFRRRRLVGFPGPVDLLPVVACAKRDIDAWRSGRRV